MKNEHNDIHDDEIRVINSGESITGEETRNQDEGKQQRPRHGYFKYLWIVIGAILFIGLIVILLFGSIMYAPPGGEDMEISLAPRQSLEDETSEALTLNTAIPYPELKRYVEITDTVVDYQPLTILTPRNSVPRLHIGVDILTDTTATLVVQAADIRADTHGIVGAYVLKGDLVSKGEAKAGFCAIIDGKMIIGVADSTPYFEQAIENDGYFFRQYPLVVGGQMVENRLKSSSLRKALADLNGETVVIISHKKMTLDEFARILVDLGVTNAIYLVGSTSFGFAKDEAGSRIEFGNETVNPPHNSNYIVWE